MSEPRNGSRGPARALRLTDLLDDLDRQFREGSARELVPVPTGFGVLDETLGGGFQPGNLNLVAGAPGVGKTTVTLQWARNMAATGRSVVYVCYEHEESDILFRLLSAELGSIGDVNSVRMGRLRRRARELAAESGSTLVDVAEGDPAIIEGLHRLRRFGDRLTVMRGSGAHTGVEELTGLLEAADPEAVLFIDYLQKVAVRPEPDTEAQKVTFVAERLKELALDAHVPIVSVVAVDRGGLEAPRLRLHHLRGSSALAFEADVAVVLNDKTSVVSKVHLAYDTVAAEAFRDWVVFSIEKNRSGLALVDLEFRKDFTHGRFHPDGGVVSERLVDERLTIE